MNTRRVSLMLLAAFSLTLPGCWKPGGSGFSLDASTYVSTEFEPKIVSIIDTRTGQALWSYDIPVGKQLVFRFYDESEEGSYLYPTLMRWDLWPAGQQFGEPSQKFLVPGRNARKVDMRLRPVPEFATPDARK
ncbi:MAG: hypothetical protein ACT4PL_09595 [Phycisphaerales bacterium]